MKKEIKKSHLTNEDIEVINNLITIKDEDVDRYFKASFDFCKNFDGGCEEVFEDEEEFFRTVNKEELKRNIEWYESVSDSEDMKKSFYDYVVISYDLGEE